MAGIKKVIQVISPSGSFALVPKANLDIIANCFAASGYEIQFSEDLLSASADIKIKVDALHNAFLDKNVSAIICAWGGFHAINIVDKLDYNLIRENSKPLIGFSDITVLLNAIYTKSGIKTYYGPLFWSFNIDFNNTYTLGYFEKALQINNTSYEIENSK